MAIYTLQHRQIVKASLQECWEFFSNPGNLATITPPWLDFKVLSDLPKAIYPGMMIEYRVRPLLGLPVTWLTEITHVEQLRSFVDEQRVGPYRVWHHEHRFEQCDAEHVEIFDLVHYVLPFGPLGALVHPFLVAPQLAEIFRFREKKVAELFGGLK